MYVQVSPHTLIPPGGEGNRVYHVLEAPGEGGVADLDEEGGRMLEEEGREGEGQTYIYCACVRPR